MNAPKGNNFWATRARHGRKPMFENGRQLWAAACEYFNWVEANPLIVTEATTDHGVPTTIDIPKHRPMSIGGLCVFLGISPSTWAAWRSRGPLAEAVGATEQLIRAEQFSGAAAGIFSANIVNHMLWTAEQRRAKKSVAPTIGGLPPIVAFATRQEDNSA